MAQTNINLSENSEQNLEAIRTIAVLNGKGKTKAELIELGLQIAADAFRTCEADDFTALTNLKK